MESMGDRVIDKLHGRTATVRERLRKQYKSERPLRMEKISNDEMLYYYNQITPDQMTYLVQKHGNETMNTFIFEMETLKNRRAK